MARDISLRTLTETGLAKAKSRVNISHEIKIQLRWQFLPDFYFHLRGFDWNRCRWSGWALGLSTGWASTHSRTANFGWNVGFGLQIDGRPVANVVQGRYYHTWLPAGEHVLTIRKIPRTGVSGPTSTTVNVQPGVIYVYTAMWDSDSVLPPPIQCVPDPWGVVANGVPGKAVVRRDNLRELHKAMNAALAKRDPGRSVRR